MSDKYGKECVIRVTILFSDFLLWKRFKEQFKQLLDAAAKTTEDKNSRLSIMFDGIGLVLASDYLEAVSKIFSMFKKLGEINKDYTGACFGY